jgi:hypothetical protein
MNGLSARLAGVAAGLTLLVAGGVVPASAQQADSNPAQGARSWLTAVAASSGRAAFAVGYGRGGPFSAGWNGRTWAPEPGPGSRPKAIFYGVAATSARQAWAVGDYLHGEGAVRFLIERWDGSTWRRIPIPDVPGAGALFGVSATSASNAWAVGEAGDPNNGYTRTLTLHWNGIAWKKVPAPGSVRGGNAELVGVTAVSGRDAWAVGDSGAASTQALVLHWNGKSWTRVPSPSFAQGSVLSGVAASPQGVWTVGTLLAAPYRTLILRWNGGHWVRVSSPSPTADGGSQLKAVAAVGQTAWAVGYAATRPLIERWIGTTWARVPTPSPAGSAYLAGVAAVSPRDAWAVGQGNGQTLILHWNGRTWRQQDR